MEESTNLLQRANSLSVKDPPDTESASRLETEPSPFSETPPSSTTFHNPLLESLDYDGVKLGAPKSLWTHQTYMDSLLRGALKWTVCALVGALTAIIAFSVNVGVENVAGLKFYITFKALNSGSYFGSYVAYTLMNCLLATGASAVVVYYGPAAAGSGIPDVKAFLNGANVPGVLEPRTLLAKIVGSIGAVSASLAVGKEGPFVHIGSCLAYLLTQGQNVSKRLNWRVLNVFRDDKQLRDFVTCGAAAGVAAAFRAPVGGVLFALEEATSWWRNQILWLAFFTTAVVSVVLRAMIRHCHYANCGFFGAGGFILFNLNEGQDSYEMFELLPMLLLGVLGGLLGSAFNAMNAQLTLWRKSFFSRRGRRARVFEAVFIAFLTSSVAFGMAMLVRCQDCPTATSDTCPRGDDSHSGNYVQFHCDDKTQHNDMATLFFNTQDDAIRSLLSSNNNKEYTVTSLLGYFVSFYFLAVLTYGVTIPSGLFVPCILCGASYGRLVGMFVTNMHPLHNIDEGTYALLGAAGFLGGASRMTVSLCVIMLELTNNLALLPLIMLVLLVAKGVGDGSGIKAIYDIHVDLKGVPFLEAQPERFMQHITALEASSQPPVVLNRSETVGKIHEILGKTTHNGFPVVQNGERGRKLLGIVLRSNLEKVVGMEKSTPDIPVHGELDNPEDAHLVPMYDNERVIDLLPMVDSSHYVVDESMPTSKVYSLFRQLGLRHIFVVPRSDKVLGVITRKDLLPDVLEGRFPSRSGSFSHLFEGNHNDNGNNGGGGVGMSTRQTSRRRKAAGNGVGKGD